MHHCPCCGEAGDAAVQKLFIIALACVWYLCWRYLATTTHRHVPAAIVMTYKKNIQGMHRCCCHQDMKPPEYSVELVDSSSHCTGRVYLTPHHKFQTDSGSPVVLYSSCWRCNTKLLRSVTLNQAVWLSRCSSKLAPQSRPSA